MTARTFTFVLTMSSLPTVVPPLTVAAFEERGFRVSTMNMENIFYTSYVLSFLTAPS